jgi:hypothetical protein
MLNVPPASEVILLLLAALVSSLEFLSGPSVQYREAFLLLS